MTEDDFSVRLQARFPGVRPVDRPEAQIKPYRTLVVAAADLAAVAAYLKEQGFGYLDMVTATDWKGPTDLKGYIEDPNPNPYVPQGAYATERMVPKANPKVEYKEAFRVAYLFSSFERKEKLALKVEVPRDNPKVPSLTGLFKTADWQEREVFDLMGVVFEGHPNLRKILTPEFIQGHPLRKDYAHQKDYLD